MVGENGFVKTHQNADYLSLPPYRWLSIIGRRVCICVRILAAK
jgi:hypothetical protein